MENEKVINEGYAPEQDRRVSVHTAPLDATPKTRWERSWPTIACGAGLFSDGYLNGVILTYSRPGHQECYSNTP